jgi:hypothetical protein
MQQAWKPCGIFTIPNVITATRDNELTKAPLMNKCFYVRFSAVNLVNQCLYINSFLLEQIQILAVACCFQLFFRDKTQ